MSLSVAGMSWVTPLGSDVDDVWQRLLAGETAPVEILENEQNGARYLVRRVPADTPFPSHPRLRRASAISRFAAAAGLAALARVKPAPSLDRIALVFAVSNGGVIYTRRFYSEIVTSGAQAASPLLFPETVFNAPASHLAAILGIYGASYTVVGDGAVGILALSWRKTCWRPMIWISVSSSGPRKLIPLFAKRIGNGAFCESPANQPVVA
jgi:3-oxoacyl-(acyl-carrier-protein) synthase